MAYVLEVLKEVSNSFTFTVCKGGFVEVILGPTWIKSARCLLPC